MRLTDQGLGASPKCPQDVPALRISRREAAHPDTPSEKEGKDFRKRQPRGARTKAEIRASSLMAGFVLAPEGGASGFSEVPTSKMLLW